MSNDTPKNGHDLHNPAHHDAAGEDRLEVSATDTENSSNNGAAPSEFWSVAETLRGKRILITGTTGFLGKVFVSMLLRYHPDVEQVYLAVRDRRNQSAYDRFISEIAESPTFEPLRDIYGAGFSEFLDEKITVLAADITESNLGLPEDDAREISSHLDVFVNSAGLTNFNPNLENALKINTLSARNILDFVRLGGSRARVVHVSTAFVAGRAQKPSPEVAPTRDVYPAYNDIQVELDPVREVEDCLALIEHAKVLSQDQERQTLFARSAREAMANRNLNPADADLLEEAIEHERWLWIKKHLSSEGQKRADHWGWVNIYTYTKSLGERLYYETSGEIDVALLRPAIIESAFNYPMPGWNEGINTTAPVTYLVYKGHRLIPCRTDVKLDVIPVDLVTGAMLGVAAALLRGKSEDVYHVGSSDLNPLTMRRVVELTSLGARQLIDREIGTSTLKKLVMKSLDAVAVDTKTFQRQSLPGFARATGALGKFLDKVPTRELGGLGKAVESVRKTTRRIETLSLTGEKIFELFLPFIHDNHYTFRARNIGALAESLVDSERALYGCDIESLDWRHYWLKIHVPGLAKWSFPSLEAKLRADTRESYTYEDLVELFDASTHNYADRVAFQHHERGRIVERYTYAELKQFAERAAGFLRGTGVRQNVSVLLVAENRPQWGMSYFGILKAGGVAVPVDPESSVDQIINLAASASAPIIVLSDKLHEEVGDEIAKRSEKSDISIRLVTFGQLFTPALDYDDDVESVEFSQLPVDPDDDLASLIFTSGTTGDPKGVMLTHQNFTSMLSSLDRTFRVDTSDGFLSVLPLHHTFEFSCGFLMPLSKGATVTYMEDLSGDELRTAMQATRVTALIGVPALWQLLHRNIKHKVDAANPATRIFFKGMLALNTALRERGGVNVGPTVFGAVHQVFGNQIRYLISGGAALPEDTLRAFHGLGFNMYEGYGLTEAAPVLTVNRPTGRLIAGSVGQPVPGVEVKVLDPDESGVGEIAARGNNVMLGYLGRDDETQHVLDGGWLKTGDLGKLDNRGRLTIVGRSKEVIVTSGGKNVYPDELEEIYGKCPQIQELAVVGLDDGRGSERVACLIKPDVNENASQLALAECQAQIRDWVRVEGQRVAAHNRIQVLRFWHDDLPRTATRKVKRRDVVDILKRLMATESEGSPLDHAEHEWTWLEKTVANLADVDASTVTPATHFVDDLAFDSLMFVELASILESRTHAIGAEQLSMLSRVNDLIELLKEPGALARIPKSTSTLDRVDEIPVHPSVAKAGKRLLHKAQMKAYGELFDVSVLGRANIPWHNPNVIVVANHSSHLDMGLVKFALGDFATDIRALAAADYFFSDPVRKTYFKQFTNLLPVERSGSPEVALKGAIDSLRRGETLLMFPEGTRATDGKLRTFRRGLGYLVATERVDVLPVYLEGTHRALPKGQPLPSPTARSLKVRIGELLSAQELIGGSDFEQQNELWDHISNRTQEAVSFLQSAYDTSDDGTKLAPLFDELSEKFERDQVDDRVSYYFSLGTIDDQKWTVIVDAEDCLCHPGRPRGGGRADCVVKTSPELFRKIVQDAYVPSFDEFVDGTIKTNSPDLLMRFQSVFRLQG